MDADGRAGSLDAPVILMMAERTQVCVNAPEVVFGEFEVTVDLHSVNEREKLYFVGPGET